MSGLGPRLALLAAALAAGDARAAGAAEPGEPAAPALVTAAEALAAALDAPVAGRASLALAVDAGGAELARPLATALAGALARRGWSVAALPPSRDPEAEARARGADWLLRVRAGLVPGGRELALVGEAVPTWESFFLQRRAGARPVPPRVVQARAPADPETLLLARPPLPPDLARLAIRPLATRPGALLALAIGDADGAGTVAIVAVAADAVHVLSTGGAPLATRPLDPAARAPVRAPRATAAVGDFGGGRIAYGLAGARGGEVLAWAPGAGRLEPVAALDAAPLCAGGAGALFGAFEPGTSMLADVATPFVEPAARPASDRRLVGAAAAPRGGGRIAWALLDARFSLQLLDRARAAAAPPLDGVGEGFALADLDGDGAVEVIASRAAAAGPDRLRVIDPLAPAAARWESAPVPGAILAGAGGDLTGDGIDDALLAAVEHGEDGAVRTTLLLVTADPREAGAAGGEAP